MTCAMSPVPTSPTRSRRAARGPAPPGTPAPSVEPAIVAAQPPRPREPAVILSSLHREHQTATGPTVSAMVVSLERIRLAGGEPSAPRTAAPHRRTKPTFTELRGRRTGAGPA